MTAETNVHDLLRAKGSRTWVQLHEDSAAEAVAAEEAGIVILSCEADQTLPGIRTAAPRAMLSAGMPHGSSATPIEAVRAAFAALQRGADAIYCSHSPRYIEAMAREGIPVTWHVGLVPNLAAWKGFRADWRKADEALAVLRKAKDIESAGAAFLEVEVVPVQLTDQITRCTPMITMGMGCGTVCDTQGLFSSDVLGTNTGHYPRQSKRYADFARLEADLQEKRVTTFRAFVDEVQQAGFPERRHEIWMDEAELEAFTRGAARIGALARRGILRHSHTSASL